jgi:hypothetical protein
MHWVWFRSGVRRRDETRADWQTRLLGSKLDHAICHVPVAAVALCPLGSENYRVVGRRRRFG